MGELKVIGVAGKVQVFGNTSNVLKAVLIGSLCVGGVVDERV